MSAPRLVLASASPRRLAILRQLGLDADVRPAHVDEALLPGEAPEAHVLRLARQKAERILSLETGQGPPGPLAAEPASSPHAPGDASVAGAPSGARPPLVVLAGDTVVVRDGVVLGKPADEEEALEMLVSLAGRTHQVLSGLALAAPDGTVADVARADVRFRQFDREDARRYVATGEPMDKAGAYGIQGLGAALVAEVRGDYYSIVGLPVSALIDLLARSGWRYAFGGLHPIG